MLLPRLSALSLMVALTACFARGSSSSPSSSGAGGSATGGAPVGGSGGAPSGSTAQGTGGASIASSSTGTSTGAGGADAGPDLDAADLGDALGKGGLPLGANCGVSAPTDAGTACGEGLACCPPCPVNQQCEYQCVIACSPQLFTCMNGCMLML